MINFKDSLQQGLQSALDRERNFQEIHNVFASLREQILEFSNNSVTLEMVVQTDPEDDNSIIDYFQNFEGLYLDKSLCLTDVNNSHNFEWLSYIRFSSNGYPCTIEIDGDRFDATDKIGLEENIKKLLATPSTGRKLFELMKSLGRV